MERTDLYTKITDTLIKQLEAGTVPWAQPPRHCGLPHNSITRRSYSGINILLLWSGGQCYGSNGWLTFKQAKEAGGTVKMGEHGTQIVYADRFIPQSAKAKAAETGDDPRAVWFLKGYTVFNTAQCEGLKDEPLAPRPTLPEMHDAADRLIRNSRATIVVGSNKAAYWPDRDIITVPEIAQYAPNEINWYRTALHELAHWTGHESRLNRNFTRFGSHEYAREELVAEMSAAFTCASLGIEPTVRHVDYIGAWLQVLREDKRAIVQAASKASKASDYLLAFEPAEIREAA